MRLYSLSVLLYYMYINICTICIRTLCSCDVGFVCVNIWEMFEKTKYFNGNCMRGRCIIVLGSFTVRAPFRSERMSGQLA